MRKFLLLVLSVAFAGSMTAKPRTPQAMLQAAQKQFASLFKTNGLRAPAVKPQLLRQDPSFSIYGYKNGGFVVVSGDDLMPEILGYSDEDASLSNGSNPNFEWWLETVKKATQEAVASGVARTTTKPDASKYQTDVASLVTAKWGQDKPYNNLCPNAPYSNSWSGSGSAKAVTGCVATAMAQILYYHKAPLHGVGTHSVGVPFDYPTNTYTVDFGAATYDWDNMLDSYSGSYNDAEAQAVATLMYHCGVAADMQYAPDGSGTYTKNAADGLKRNFGLSEDCHVETRSQYSEADWMDLVYTEVDAGRPILYTGVSGWSGGHAFVLDGYNSDGKVHINWGWNGDDNGMFDIATLSVQGYSFSSDQDMCVGISPERTLLAGDTINLQKAGTLSDSIAFENRTKVGLLKVTGPMNSHDMAVVRYMCGISADGTATKGQLNSLDLSEAEFVDGYSLPDKLFYGSRRLSKLSLPKGITHIGDGALAAASLRELDLQPSDTADFVIIDNIVYSKADSTDLIAVLPVKSGYVTLPVGVKTIHDYAMANCRSAAGLRLASTVEKVGVSAFENMSSLSEIRLYSKEPPITGDNALKGLSFGSTKLYIPAGSKTRYKNHSQWGKFKTSNYDNIIEFGTKIKARNAFKIYGDPAPKRLGWKVSGDRVHGEPEVSCDVNELTPAGRYPIHINRGTIREQEGVEYEDGYIIVAPDTLHASVGNYTRDANDPDPDFKIVITGFDNGEDESVIDVMPTVTSSATATSPAGEYDLVVSGGEDNNYIFDYVNGKLTITGVVDGIDNVAVDGTIDGKNVRKYNLAGQLVDDNYRGIIVVNGRKYVSKGK